MPSPEDLCKYTLDQLEPGDLDPRGRAEEALLSLLRSWGDTDIVDAYEQARDRCGWAVSCSDH